MSERQRERWCLWFGCDYVFVIVSSFDFVLVFACMACVYVVVSFCSYCLWGGFLHTRVCLCVGLGVGSEDC